MFSHVSNYSTTTPHHADILILRVFTIYDYDSDRSDEHWPTVIGTRMTFRDGVTSELIPHHVSLQSAVVHGNLIINVNEKKS